MFLKSQNSLDSHALKLNTAVFPVVPVSSIQTLVSNEVEQVTVGHTLLDSARCTNVRLVTTKRK